MESKNSTFRIVMAAVIGHVLEFYDFAIYAVFAVKIGQLFFPSSSDFAQILSSLAVFAVGFFMRPLGGVLFGHIGDKYGRRTSLTISVIGMAIATFCIGFMPTYETVESSLPALGFIAPFLLVLCRLIQGLCVGGEGAGASIFVLEHLHGFKPGFVGGIVNSALTLGILLAIMMGKILVHYLGEHGDAWRYAFMIGGLLGIVGLYLRITIDETPVFKEMQEKGQIVEIPIKEVFTHNWRNVLLTIAVGGVTGASGYFIMAYMNTFFHTVMSYSLELSLYYSAIGNILLVILLPLMGLVSDRYGYAKTIAVCCVIVLFVSVPLFSLLASDNEPLIYLSIFGIAILVAGIYAPLYPFMLNLFTPEQRYSGIACSLNIGIAMFGGTCTMICLALIKYTNIIYSPAFYWDFVAVMFLGALYMIQGRSSKTIEECKERAVTS